MDDGRLRLAMANPEIALELLDKIDGEESLLKFIRVMWHVLEPGREFVEGRVLNVLCEHLEAVTRGQIRKLLINVPPGTMKSLTTNVFWPAWEWGPQDMAHTRWIHASYSHELMLRDNRRCRQLIGDEKYQRIWGDRVTISDDQDTKGKFENTKLGWKLATSVGGAVVGERGDRFIIDDPHNIKNAESTPIRESTLQWFTEVVPSRVNDPDKATFVIIMQRVHERDVSGLVLANDLGYEYLCLPMEFEDDHPTPSRTSLGFKDWRTTPGELLWPERFTASAVDELKAHLKSWGGEYAIAGQMQQRPTPRGGGMFRRAWWRFFKTEAEGFHRARPNMCSLEEAVPLPTSFDWKVLSVDASFKKTATGSRVSCMVIAGRGPYIYLLDNVTRHMTFKETCDTILTVDEKGKVNGGLYFSHNPDKILIEDKANGPAIINTLRQFASGIIPIEPQGGKESRAQAIEPRVESGHVLLPEGAPWLDDFITEFASFPVGRGDDQVDAVSQTVIYMTANAGAQRVRNMAKW